MKILKYTLFIMLPLLVSMNSHAGNTNQSEDVLQKAAAMNSKQHPLPATSYRKGHVAQHAIKNYVKSNGQGYVIDLPGSYPIGTPTFYKGRLYVSGGFGSRQFYCFDAGTGQTIWAIDLDDDGPSSCVIEDGIVVFNTESCTLFACRADNGQMLWSWWLGDPLTSAPAISGGRVFTTYPANGQMSAQHDQGKRDPDASHVMGCFDLHTGKILWQKWIDGDAISAPVVAGPEVFITTFSGTLYAFNTKDGAIEQYRADTGQLERRYPLEAPIRFQPIVMNGRIFSGTQDGRVICIDTRDPKLTGWPSWGRDAAHTGLVQ